MWWNLNWIVSSIQVLTVAICISVYLEYVFSVAVLYLLVLKVVILSCYLFMACG